MNGKIFRKLGRKFGQMVRDKRAMGTMAIIGIVLIILIAGGFFLLTWMILANLETIGKGLLYIAGALLAMIGVAVLAKRYLFPKKGVS